MFILNQTFEQEYANLLLILNLIYLFYSARVGFICI